MTPPTSASPESRARNGGTSAPTGGSVWDIPAAVPDDTPTPSAAAPVAPAPVRPESIAPAAPPAPEPDVIRPTEPLLGSLPVTAPDAAEPAAPVATPKPAVPKPKPTAAPEPKRAAAQTPLARQREKARLEIAAAAAGQPVRRGPSVRTLALVAAGVIGLILVSAVAWFVLLGGDDTQAAVTVGTLADAEPAAATTLAAAPLETALPATEVPVTQAPTPTAPSTTAAPTTVATAPETTAPAPETTAPDTTAPATTVPVATDDEPPATTAPRAAAAAAGPRIVIEPRREPCKFGNDCLVAGFSLVEFPTQPDSFVCEFADGSRYTIPLTQQQVDYACATGTPGESITIEIAGIRSDTAVHD